MAMILDAFMSKFSELLVQMVQDEVGMLLGIPGEIEKLTQTVGDVQAVLVDAEAKQIKSELIKRWLLELKDVMYDADDVMDLCQIKYEERRARLDSTSSSKLSCGFFHLLSCFRNPAFAHEIGIKIKRINARLEGIAKRKTTLGLIETQVVVAPSHVRRLDSVIHSKTDPSVVIDDLVGEKIEEDAKLLVGWLIEEEKSEKRAVGVVAVEGMGGIGKTTLAKRVFNDPIVKEEFKLKIWACVSKDAKEVELLKSIIQQAGDEVRGAEEKEVLVPMLQKVVKEKKFLLVLDDVWPKSVTVWNDSLRDAMSGGSPGSKLLVTTRNKTVAKRMKAANIHSVEKLSEEDGWSLLKKQVFDNEEDSEIQEFKQIGLQLVRKCDGLPLAIKSIGGVLCVKDKTISEWDRVLESSAWSTNELPNEIHRALYLSYEDLSSVLKQCFIICSLYPEDYEFSKDDFVYHWIAEGFLQHAKNPYEQGVEYYNELLLRNLLEYTGIYRSKMHDTLWTFAHHLGKDESCILTDGQVLNRQRCPIKLRRLSIVDHNVNLEDVKKEKALRTLVFNNIPENTLSDLCTSFPNLRILDIEDSSGISTLPDSLFSLVHLRYFYVSDSSITTIPEAIGLLKNLVYLSFERSKKLAHVPHNITNLEKLMYISFGEADSLEGFPSGLKNFEKLTHLYGFKPNNNSLKGFSGLEDLEHLLHLVDLSLEDLEKVSDINTAKRANLYSKKHLEFLDLTFTNEDEEYQLSQPNEKKVTIEGVLNELCPPSSIKDIKIQSYYGSNLPNWLNSGANLPELRKLVINNCNCFERLAPLGQLPNLDELDIIGACSIETIGEEFLWGDIKKRDTTARSRSIKAAFPKLTKLRFENLSNWKVWEWNKGKSAMPKLKKLSIKQCPELKSLPKGLFQNATSLKRLKIVDADNLAHVENCSSVQYMRVSNNQNLERISNMSSVSYIEIWECPELKTVENLPALQKMELSDSDMEALPEFVMKTTPLKLEIYCSEKLWREITTQRENGSEWHKFKHIPNVTFYSSGERLYATYQKTPFSFTIDEREDWTSETE